MTLAWTIVAAVASTGKLKDYLGLFAMSLLRSWISFNTLQPYHCHCLHSDSLQPLLAWYKINTLYYIPCIRIKYLAYTTFRKLSLSRNCHHKINLDVPCVFTDVMSPFYCHVRWYMCAVDIAGCQKQKRQLRSLCGRRNGVTLLNSLLKCSQIRSVIEKVVECNSSVSNL